MEQVTCFRCGRPMAAGFARAPHGIQWRTPAEPPLRWRRVWRVLRNTLAWWSFRENPAWRCAECELLVVDHSHSLPTKRPAAQA